MSDATMSDSPMPDRRVPDTKHMDVRALSFEHALKELEGIVGRLERGDVALEESITIYERGEVLRDHCDRLLRQAEAKVEKLTFDAHGAPRGTEPRDPAG
jgi:exodeoxyribonuclease VII small subunit